MYSTNSFACRDTDDTSKAYALAGSDASYKYYNGLSISFWVCGFPGTNKDLLAVWETSTGNKRTFVYSTQSDGKFRTIYSWDGTNFSLKKTQNAIFDGSWKLIITTFNNGTETVTVNDVSQTLDTTIAWGGGAAGLYNSSIQFMFCGENASAPTADKCFGGFFNNVAMWNVVLSAAEKTELYHYGRTFDLTKHSKAANLTNWWSADQSSSNSTIVDKIASGANATITKTGSSAFMQLCNTTQGEGPGVARNRIVNGGF